MSYTRISNSYLSETVIQNLLTNRSKLVDIQEQISSGKRVTKPSDDVVAASTVLSTKNSVDKIDNYLKNISTAQAELDTTDSVISTVIDTALTARSLVLQAVNASSGEDEIEMINTQLKQAIEQIKTLANTEFSGKYLFGGLDTDTAPFAVPVTGEIQYTGSEDTPASAYQRNVEISDGVTVAINLNGRQVFGEYYTSGAPATLDGQGLFKTLISITNELDLASPDIDSVRSMLDSIDTDITTLENAQSQVGGVSQRLEITKNIIEENKINLIKVRSNAEDIDITKAISDMQFQETALQASLSVSARIIQPSLLDYI